MSYDQFEAVGFLIVFWCILIGPTIHAMLGFDVPNWIERIKRTIVFSAAVCGTLFLMVVLTRSIVVIV